MDDQDRAWLIIRIGQHNTEILMRMANGDGARARELYGIDFAMRNELRPELELLELTLRNRYHDTMERARSGQPTWLLDNRLPVQAILQDHAPHVYRELTGGRLSPVEAVNKLTFGFWKRLTSSALEKALWVRFLHEAYAAGSNRSEIHTLVCRAVTLRNRVAHCNTVIDVPLNRYIDDVWRLLEQLTPELAAERRQSSRLPELLHRLETWRNSAND